MLGLDVLMLEHKCKAEGQPNANTSVRVFVYMHLIYYILIEGPFKLWPLLVNGHRL